MRSAAPVVAVALLYGEWLLSWAVLGHVPRPSLDDPKDVAIAHWLMLPTALALVGFVPAAAAAALAHVGAAIEQGRSLAHGVARGLGALALAGLVVLLFRWDPGGVVYWWFD